jgi:hypothetical protein
MGVHMTVEGAIVSRGPVPIRPKLVQSSRGKSRGGSGMSTTIGVDPHKLIDVCGVRETSTSRVWYLVMVQRVGECIYEQGWWGRVDGSRGGKRKTRGEVRKRTDVPLHLQAERSPSESPTLDLSSISTFYPTSRVSDRKGPQLPHHLSTWVAKVGQLRPPPML